MMDPAERPGLVQDPELQMVEQVLKVVAAPEPPHAVHVALMSPEPASCGPLCLHVLCQCGPEPLQLSSGAGSVCFHSLSADCRGTAQWPEHFRVDRVIILEWQLRSDPVCVLVSGLFH